MIGEYITKGIVDVFDFRGLKKPHIKVMNDCYHRNYQIYDWLIFYDLDEYIHLFN